MVSNGGHGIERQVAVLIDVENVGLGAIQWLFDQISDYGRVTIKRAYGDWSSVTRPRATRWWSWASSRSTCST